MGYLSKNMKLNYEYWIRHLYFSIQLKELKQLKVIFDLQLKESRGWKIPWLGIRRLLFRGAGCGLRKQLLFSSHLSNSVALQQPFILKLQALLAMLWRPGILRDLPPPLHNNGFGPPVNPSTATPVSMATQIRKTALKAEENHTKVDSRILENHFCDFFVAIPLKRKPCFKSPERLHFAQQIDSKSDMETKPKTNWSGKPQYQTNSRNKVRQWIQTR